MSPKLKGRQHHAPVHHVLVVVQLDIDIPGGLRLERHAVDVLLRELGHYIVREIDDVVDWI